MTSSFERGLNGKKKKISSLAEWIHRGAWEARQWPLFICFSIPILCPSSGRFSTSTHTHPQPMFTYLFLCPFSRLGADLSMQLCRLVGEIIIFHSRTKKSILFFNLFLNDCQRKLVNRIFLLHSKKKKGDTEGFLLTYNCLGFFCDHMHKLCHRNTD